MFETSFYALISTSGHIFLIYGAGVPRPSRTTAARPRPRAPLDILLDRPTAL